ncbi:PREDICTED: flexible cuticle protein 12-like [Bactrocera latifrons]|uniref:Flexible cuticle protein 12 n=1 Tax=Bactrocera latifrons TaxID=174628 RepID=A0A0K8VBK2_BACLA|nr:PREDICTED: flexible cuticle protein 12-like [Bactrocera latifrons]
MKFTLSVLVIYGLIALGCSAPLDDSANARLLRYDFDNIGVDGYDFSFETSDGTERKESAELKDFGGDSKALIVDGFSTWIAPDGQKYTLHYLADETGFHPWGDHLPQFKPKYKS